MNILKVILVFIVTYSDYLIIKNIEEIRGSKIFPLWEKVILVTIYALGGITLTWICFKFEFLTFG